MRLDPDQLEWIVREVVRRLREASGSSAVAGERGAETRASAREAVAAADAHVTLVQSLITTATLEHKLDGVTQLTIPKKAVVTPAARDLLRERGIALTRS